MLALSGTVTATALAVAPASAASSQVVMVSCAGHGMVRPSGYDIGCTANELLRSLHWQTWRGTAYGNGILKVDDCTPTCAQVLHRLLDPDRAVAAHGVAGPPGAPLLHAADLDLHRQAARPTPWPPDHHPRRPLTRVLERGRSPARCRAPG